MGKKRKIGKNAIREIWEELRHNLELLEKYVDKVFNLVKKIKSDS